MSRSLSTLALLLVPLVVQAQTPQYVTDALNKQGIKRGLVTETGEAFKRSTLDLFGVVADAQKRWVDVRDEREQWLQRYRIYENVISLRGKDEMMKWTDAQRAKLGVDELAGYQRLGIHNPYETTSYLRYYGHDGKLKISEVRGYYDDLERQRLDIEKSRQRLIDAQQSVSASYQRTMQAYQAARTAREDAAQAQRELEAAQTRYQQERAAAAKPPAEAGKKLCYITWFDNSPHYGGMTRAEALAEGRGDKQRNPSYRIRVTEHLCSPTMSIDAISRTPGTVILDLP